MTTQPDQPKAHQPDQPSQGGRQITPLILVIDDDQATRLLLRRAMERDGYLVAEANDGMQGLHAYERLRPDLVLLDAMMPLLNGFDTCAQIQQLPGGRTTPILLITALDDNESVDRAFAAGAADYVTKPIHWAVLRQRVRRILQARKSEEVIRLRDRAIMASSNGVIITDAQSGNRTITYVNSAIERLTGYLAQDLLGESNQVFVGPDTDPATLALLDGAVQNAHELQVTIKHYRKDGSSFWDQVSVAPVLDSRGHLSHFVWVHQDVTGRVEAEAALQRANEQLQGWVNQLQQRNREITTMGEMSELFQSCRNPSDAYQVIAQTAKKLLPGTSGSISSFKPDQPATEVAASWGRTISEPTFVADSCWALRRGRVHAVPDTRDGLLCSHLLPPLPSAYICVPMIAQGEILGVLTISYPTDYQHDSIRRLTVMLAEQSALALANLRLQETLRNQSIRDPLTGLFNRRYMEGSLDRELSRAIRNQTALGVIMLDIDHFKRFNDTFGHLAGDVLLRELGKFLQRRIRREDIACRYGGEEFALILPDANLAHTEQRALQLCNEIRELVVQYRDEELGQVTLSLGVAVFPDHANTPTALLQAADEALYAAKRGGRARVVVAGVPAPPSLEELNPS